MTSKIKRSNLNDVIGKIICDYLSEQAAENEKNKSTIYRSTLLIILLSVLTLTSIGASFILRDIDKAPQIHSKIEVVQSLNFQKVRAFFQQEYQSVSHLILASDFELARKELVGNNADILDSKMRCTERICNQYFITQRINLKFVTHNDDILYVSVSK